MLSLITITYNAAAYLEETLNSVLPQMHSGIEHIVWDGGSQDETLSILKRYPHITLYQGKDRGISDAMNQAAARAQGKFLWYLHADDVLAPRAVTILETAILQHPCIEWFYGQVQIIDEKGEVKRQTPFEPYSLRRLRKYNFISHPATVMTKRLFDAVGGFSPELHYCMDYDLWLRGAQQATPLALPCVLAAFREHLGSTSTRERHGVADEAYHVRNRYIRTLWERWQSYRTWQRRRRAL